ncbi:hypothetical protein N7470_007230 [Penicillium chermesinum]|nr:hypothetical protein N7470_007230 [Penicillium chermesinum]
MAPRRTHTKSRNGCDQCKRRRVKCDESGPPCTNCISRELDCTYSKLPTRDTTSQNGLTSRRGSAMPRDRDHPATPRSLGPVSPASTSSASSGIRDLELMHRFATETFRSVTTTAVSLSVWQKEVPHLALKHDFLMNGILALAALDIANTLEPPASLAYVDTALQYHNLSFAPFRAAIDDLTPLNCEAVLAQSMITTVIGIFLPRAMAPRDEPSNMTENIITLFELLQGIKNIIQAGQSWIKLNLYTSQIFFQRNSLTELESPIRKALDRLGTLNEETLAIIDPEEYRINKDIIANLRYCYTLFTNSGDPSNVIAWLAGVDKEFVNNVRRRQPLALLILMHWGGSPRRVGESMVVGTRFGSCIGLGVVASPSTHPSSLGGFTFLASL